MSIATETHQTARTIGKKVSPRVELGERATEAIQRATSRGKVDMTKAKALFAEALTGKARLTAALVDFAAEQLLNDALRNRRDESWAPVARAAAKHDFVPADQMRHLAEVRTRGLLDYILPVSGVSLGQANRTQVEEAAAHYRRIGASALGKALFFDAVAKRMGEARRVVETVSEDEAAALQAKALRGAAEITGGEQQ